MIGTRFLLALGAAFGMTLGGGVGFAQELRGTTPHPQLERALPKPTPPQATPADAQRQEGKAATALAPAEQAERLFGRLRDAKTDREAKGVAALILRRWAKSGSDTADLLMTRLQQAVKSGDLNLAMEVADRVVALAPEWAEAWNQRANLFFRLDDPVRAVLDLGEALKREPRHFGALHGLATILKRQGDDKGALKAYRETQKLYPLMEGLKEAVDRLAPDVDGRDA